MAETDLTWKYEKDLKNFLKLRIQKLGGRIELQHITGHLSQLSPTIRNALGTSKNDIVKFINKNCDTFMLDKNIVSLIGVDNKSYDSDESSINTESSLPNKISNGKGVIVKLDPKFGFIKSQHPVKTSIFFRASHFGFDRETNLTECGLIVGTMVNFDAVKEKRDTLRSKYIAKKVCKTNDEEQIVVNYPRKNPASGQYDPINLDGEGTIMNVFPTHGFIAVDNNAKNNVFFHKDRVVNYENITDLTQVFQIGEHIEFSAHRTTKENTKARWEATKVWKKSSRKPIVKEKVFINSNFSASNITTKSNSSVISSDKTLSLPSFYSKSSSSSLKNGKIKESAREGKTKEPVREMIQDQCGKLCLRANGSVIKFGEGLNQLADADSSKYYILGTQVTEISWEFSEGQDVKFDAVKIKSTPGWKAILVWTGDKPDVTLSPHLGKFCESACETDEESEKNNDHKRVLDDDNDDITDDGASLSSFPKSVSSHSSLKSESLLSDISDYRMGLLPLENYTNTELTSKEVKTANIEEHETNINGHSICKSPLISRSPSSSSSSNLSSDLSKCSERSHKSKESGKCQKTFDFGSSEKSSQNARFINLSNKSSHNLNEPSHSDSEKSENSVVKDHIKNMEAKAKQNIKKSASIMKHENVVGEITQIYATFAEAKSSEFQDTVTFSKNIFYCNKESMDAMDLNDLRKVVKVGQKIYFNNFQIVDDDGLWWQKVSLAWIGSKPLRVHEVTPKEFIEQNNLSVTLNDEPEIQPEKDVNKFLFACDEIDSYETDELGVSQTESHSEDDLELHSPKSLPEVEILKEVSSEFKSLSSNISQKLMRIKPLLMDSKVDLNELSSEIVYMVLEKYSIEESSHKLRKTEKESVAVSCSCKKVESASSYPKIIVKDSETQTISTGTIMGLNIFAEG